MLHLRKKDAWNKTERLQLGVQEADRGGKREITRNHPHFNTLYGGTVHIFCTGSRGGGGKSGKQDRKGHHIIEEEN